MTPTDLTQLRQGACNPCIFRRTCRFLNAPPPKPFSWFKDKRKPKTILDCRTVQNYATEHGIPIEKLETCIEVIDPMKVF